MKSGLIKLNIFIAGVLLLSAAAYAGKIQTCRVDGSFCLAQVENGIIGDQVRILDEKASQVATGRIEKKNKSIALIRVQTKTKIPKRGYPVIVKVEKRLNTSQWAGAFSNME